MYEQVHFLAHQMTGGSVSLSRVPLLRKNFTSVGDRGILTFLQHNAGHVSQSDMDEYIFLKQSTYDDYEHVDHEDIFVLVSLYLLVFLDKLPLHKGLFCPNDHGRRHITQLHLLCYLFLLWTEERYDDTAKR